MRTILVAAMLAVMAFIASPTVKADPAEDDAFVAAITGDGISMGRSDAITDGHAVCKFLLSGSGSMLDAMIQVKQQHSWSMTEAAHFVDRSVQNYCPSRAPF
jgi:hypothetical protein